jgi:cold shock CspA family protein
MTTAAMIAAIAPVPMPPQSRLFMPRFVFISVMKTWLANRGMGLIENASGGPSIFVHINALRVGGIDPNELKRGDHLAFEISEGPDRRPAAVNVRRVE